MVHHNNCTWCRHRLTYKTGPKRKIREIERCGITGKNIPPPGNLRWCEHYQQDNCQCEACSLTIASAV